MGGDLDLPLLQPLLEVATSLCDVHSFRLPWLGTFTTQGVLSRMKGVWLATMPMKPIAAFGLSQTNQQLLQEGLISPLVFELWSGIVPKRLSSERRRSMVSGSMGEGSKPMCR